MEIPATTTDSPVLTHKVIFQKTATLHAVHGDGNSDIVHCQKYPYIHGYFVASFPYFNGTGPVYVCVRIHGRNQINEAWAVNIAIWARASLFRRFTDTNVGYTEPVPLKWKPLANSPPDKRIFFTVYCGSLGGIRDNSDKMWSNIAGVITTVVRCSHQTVAAICSNMPVR